MHNMQKANGTTTGIRLAPDDWKIIRALQKKTGVKALSEILRQGLRALAAKEGVTA